MKKLSEKLKFYRNHSKMTQDSLSEKLGVSRQTISNWETGKNYPDIYNIISICTLYEIDIQDLIQDDIPIMIKKTIIYDKRKAIYLYSISMMITFILFLFFLINIKNDSFLYFFLSSISLILFIFISAKLEMLKKALEISTHQEIKNYLKKLK